MVAYHDEEWGVPVHDDRRFFEFLILEGAQAGLSWSTVLRKREHYRKVFAGFDPARVARFGKRDVERLLADPGIIRNRLKVEGAIRNAKAFLAIQDEHGSFDAWVWRFVGGAPIDQLGGAPCATSRPPPPESDALSRELKKRGFKFVGSTIMLCVHAGHRAGQRPRRRLLALEGARRRLAAREHCRPAKLPPRFLVERGNGGTSRARIHRPARPDRRCHDRVRRARVVLLLVKLVFKIVLFPIKLAGGLIFGVLGVIGAIVLAVVALPLLAVLIPVLPPWPHGWLRPRGDRGRVLARVPHPGLDLLSVLAAGLRPVSRPPVLSRSVLGSLLD